MCCKFTRELSKVVVDVVQADIQGVVAELHFTCLSVDHTVGTIGVHLGVELDNVVSLGVNSGLGDHGVLSLVSCHSEGAVPLLVQALCQVL